MSTSPYASFGNFTIFGFTDKPKEIWTAKVERLLGVTPKVIDFGRAGNFFFYTSHGNVAEDAEKIVLLLGFARTVDGAPLTAQKMLKLPEISPEKIVPNVLRGNALVAAFSKKEAAFLVYKTLLAMPQLFFHAAGATLFCADNLACLTPFLKDPALNEAVLAQHFVSKFALGTATYFKDVYRLFPGEGLAWREGRLQVTLLQDLRFREQRQFKRLDAKSLSYFHNKFSAVMEAYLNAIEQAGDASGNLLSGGVDSSLIQYFIGQHSGAEAPPRSFSYAVETSDFEFEADYARQASSAFQTAHTFVNIAPRNYPDLLQETIAGLAQPVFTNAEPCKLALGQYLRQNEADRRFYFVGQGADALLGLPIARKLAILAAIHKFPAADKVLVMLAAMVAFLRPSASQKAHGLRHLAEMLPELNNPYSLKMPPDTLLTADELKVAFKSFGKEAVGAALKARHTLEAQYLQSSHLVEKFQVIDTLTEGYEHAIYGYQAFLLNKKTQILPYFDEELLRATFDFAPTVRYAEPGLKLMDRHNVKPALRRILERHAPLAAQATRRPKGFSVFNNDVYSWMKNGVLQEMVCAMDRPAFLSKQDFQYLLTRPREFAWRLLTLDIFQKRVLKKLL